MPAAPFFMASLGYVATGLAYAALAIWLLIPREQNSFRLALALASLLMVAQALVHLAWPNAHMWALSEVLRSLGWLAVLVSLAAPGAPAYAQSLKRSWPLWTLGLLALLEGIDIFASLFTQTSMIVLHIAGLIGGILLVHGIYVRALPSERWAVRMVVIALAALYAYDLHLYTFYMLEGRVDHDLWSARGFVNALLVPLFLLSLKRAPRLRLHPSHQLMLHSITFIMVGLYLLAMALAAYGVRLLGGDWGALLGISVIFTAAVAGGILLFSGHARAFIRVQLAKHLFAHKYDYRDIWLRFLQTVSRQEEGYGDLRMRVVQSIAEISNSPGALLYVPDAQGDYIVAARWNFTRASYAALPAQSPLISVMKSTAIILDFSQIGEARQKEVRPEMEDWQCKEPHAWLMVPLLHLDRLVAVVVLETALVARTLDWEDYDLLRILGRQSASYIAEHDSQVALSEARRFEDFNRRFAFVMHDIKNLVSQLGLLARNARRHGNNPAFRDDMVHTLENAVGKLSHLLQRLDRKEIAMPESAEAIDLAEQIGNLAEQYMARGARVEFICEHRPHIIAGSERIEQLFSHLVQNALEASADGQKVTVRLGADDRSAIVQVEDRGCGMDDDFIRSHLFAPFLSTKSKGFGLGAYEAREIARSYGGQIEVQSQPGKGSVFCVRLPLAHGFMRDDQKAALS